jgi:hypothetical protein
MFIPDLVPVAAGQPPSPYGFPLPIDKDGKPGVGRLPPGLTLLPIGWLANSVPTSGPVAGPVIDRLLREYQTGAVFCDGTAGWHDCELCPGPEAWYSDGQIGPVVSWAGQRQRLYGHGHYLLRHGAKVFMAPALLVHYIVDHTYRPPDQFTHAVLEGTFLRPNDLVWAEFDPEGNLPSA